MAWSLFGVLVVIKAAVMGVPLSWRTQLVLSDSLTYFLPMLLAIVLAAYLGVRSRQPVPGERVFWGLLAAALAAGLATEVYWTWYAVVVDPRGTPPGSYMRLFHAVAAVLMFVLLVRQTRFGLLPFAHRVRFGLDVLSAIVIAWPFVYLFWTYPALGVLPGAGPTGAAVAAAYPLFGGAVILFTTLVVFASAGRSRPTWERLAAASLWLYGVGLFVFPILLRSSLVTPVEGSSWYTLFYGFGSVLLLVAMVYRMTTADAADSLEPWPLPRALTPRSTKYLPVVSATALPLVGALALSMRRTPAGDPLFEAVWALGVLLAVRSLIAAVERARISARAATDPMTGVYTRKMLDRRLLEVVEYAGETGGESSVVVFDTRETRRITDLGREHPFDRTSSALVLAVRGQMSDNSEIFRVTVSSFAVIIEGHGPAQAAEFALSVCLAAGRHEQAGIKSSLQGVCAGVASFPVHAIDAGLLLAAAEVAVSAAHGVDGEPVVVYDEEIARVPAEEHVIRERMRIQRTTVRALAEAVDARDPATRDHSVNVAELATALAQVVGLSDSRVQIVGLGALMHDIGKIGVRDELLLKPGALDAAERAEVEEHAVLGERILAPARLDEVLPLVRWHHERWDGAGYPDGLAGEDIPIEARILAVCDAFETMTTGRPYADALTLDEALDDIETKAGTQFDAALASAFIRMVRGLGQHRTRPAQRPQAGTK